MDSPLFILSLVRIKYLKSDIICVVWKMPLSSVDQTVEVRVGDVSPPDDYLKYVVVGGAIGAILVAIFLNEMN